MVEFDKNTLTINNIFTNRFTHNNKEVNASSNGGATLVGQYTLYFDQNQFNHRRQFEVVY